MKDHADGYDAQWQTAMMADISKVSYFA